MLSAPVSVYNCSDYVSEQFSTAIKEEIQFYFERFAENAKII